MHKDAGSRIQREIRQSRPFRSKSHEAVAALFRTADVARRHLSEVVAAEAITLQQYNVLRILRGAGPQGLPTLEVADRMVEHTPGITRMMDRLEARGWVSRARCPTDRREVHCRITAEGLALLGRLDTTVDAADRVAVGNLDARSLATLVRLLDRIRSAHATGSAPAQTAAVATRRPRVGATTSRSGGL